jgi:hypothetical protein
MNTLKQLLAQKQIAMNLVEVADGELTPELELKLKQSEMSLLEKADAYAAVRDELYSTVEHLKAKENEFKTAREHVETYIERFEKRLIDTLLERGMTELVGEDVVFKISPTRGTVEITDQDAAKLFYGREKVTIDIDKAAIREALDSGEQLSFAKIQQNYSIKQKVRK